MVEGVIIQVPEPVRSRSETHADTSVSNWVQFCVYSPNQWTPADGEGGNGKAGECNQSRSGLGSEHGVLVIECEMADESVHTVDSSANQRILTSSENRGSLQEAHHHPSSASHEDDTSSEAANDP